MLVSFVNQKLIAFLTCLREHVTFSVHLIGAQSRLRGYTCPIHVCPDPFLSLRRGLGTRLSVPLVVALYPMMRYHSSPLQFGFQKCLGSTTLRATLLLNILLGYCQKFNTYRCLRYTTASYNYVHFGPLIKMFVHAGPKIFETQCEERGW